jgi:hypothetical protein
VETTQIFEFHGQQNWIHFPKEIQNLDESDEDGKVEDKVHRRRGHGGYMESRGIAVLFLQPRRWIGVGCQQHAPIALPTGKTSVRIIWEAEWAPGPVWTDADNLVFTGSHPQTIHPVDSQYTD